MGRITGYSIVVLVTAFFAAATAHAQITVQQLRCEMLNNPKGIDVVQPRLSWLVNGGVRGIQQTAYQVLVASSPEKLARAFDYNRQLANVDAIFERVLGS